jgi:putative regulator of septum formation
MRRLLLPLLVVALTACTGGSDEPSADPTPSASTSAPAPPTATAVPPPDDRACYALDYDEAVAPTSDADPVDCQGDHTSMTFSVGVLDTVVDGHLLAVDSDRVQAQVAGTCPDRLAGLVGGTLGARRLSMLRAVWFTPTVEESDAGASWYRCDVTALAGDERLAPLTGRLAGVLDGPAGQERYGMCGTAEPGTPAFARVICSDQHSWRAVATVPFRPDGPYPGLEKVRGAGDTPCQDAARAVADDTLNFQWGYEWPTAEQWAAGQTYGLCWAPD